MANFILKIEAPELVDAIHSLASALQGSAITNVPVQATTTKDVTEISEAKAVEKVKTPIKEEHLEQYTMFQDMAKLAKELQELDEELYTTVLYKFVPEGKKYSAIPAANWGTASKSFAEAIESYKSSSVKKEEEPEEPEPEEVITIGELRSLSARAKNQGVKVGAIIKEIAGVTKISAIPLDKYSDYKKAILAEMEG